MKSTVYALRIANVVHYHERAKLAQARKGETLAGGQRWFQCSHSQEKPVNSHDDSGVLDVKHAAGVNELRDTRGDEEELVDAEEQAREEERARELDARFPWTDVPEGSSVWLEMDAIAERLTSALSERDIVSVRSLMGMILTPDANGFMHWSSVETVDDFLGNETRSDWYADMARIYRAVFDAGIWVREGERIRYDSRVFLVAPDDVDPNGTSEVEA